MKIAIISPWAISYNAVGGTERFVKDLAETFTQLGNQVDVYMLSGKSHNRNDVSYINIDLFDTHQIVDEFILQEKCGDFDKTESFYNIAKLLESKINLEKYDLIHFNSQLFLTAYPNKKRIFTIHTNPFEYKLAFGDDAYLKMVEIMKTQSSNPLTTFVAPSKYYANIYQELTGTQIVSIPHGIDISRLESIKTKSDLLKFYNLGDENIIRILLPSRVEPIQKQPMVFIEALGNISKDLRKNVQVICTGLDTQYEKYSSSIREYCEENEIDIVFIRFDGMADAYCIADIIALPSRSESFGYSALESLSLGIPTIMNNLPTFSEIAQGYDGNCYIFHNNNELEEIINSLLKNIPNKYIPGKSWQNRYSLIKFGEKYLNI